MGACAIMVTWHIQVKAQYDYPIDSCACHIHYEFWVQLQYQLSQVLNSDFSHKLFQEGSNVQELLSAQECRNPRRIKNLNEWTLVPTSSDCAPGHMSHYILCAQAHLMMGDVEGARLYFDFANYIFPVAMPCMDPVIWTITPDTFYDNYRAVVLAAENLAHHGVSSPSFEEIKALAWRTVDNTNGIDVS